VKKASWILVLSLGVGSAAYAAGGHHAGVDADRDGVPDSEDWCLGTPPGVRVGPDGCAPGEIGDWAGRGAGVKPAAAPTPKPAAAPVRTAREARAAVERAVLRGTSFATGSAVLRPEAETTLREVASILKADSRLRVEVGGHTDSVGDPARNQTLSERRAQAVKDFLVKEGVNPNQLTVRGYGASRPVDTNETPAGRANNRRVEFKAL
jgi:OmpA-OmpF porin, OOP family